MDDLTQQNMVAVAIAALGSSFLTTLVTNIYTGRANSNAKNAEAHMHEEEVRQKLWTQVQNTLDRYEETITAIEEELSAVETEAAQQRISRVAEIRQSNEIIFGLEEQIRDVTWRLNEMKRATEGGSNGQEEASA